jgi:hypothetical protein
MADGWSVTGRLCTGGVDAAGQPTGRVAPIPYPISPTPPGVVNQFTQPEVTFQSKFELNAGGPGAQYYTIEFNITPPTSGYVFCLAEIIWSAQGNEVRRLISLVNGAVISGTAQFAKVRIFDNTFIPAAPFLTPEVYQVSAQITPGCRPAQQQPPRLRGGLIDVAPGGSVDIPIPVDAGVISVNIQHRFIPIAGGTAVVSFLAAGGTVVFSTFNIEQAGPADWIPVPPGATIMRILNGPSSLEGSETWGIEG